jgi:hypothetical protein
MRLERGCCVMPAQPGCEGRNVFMSYGYFVARHEVKRGTVQQVKSP